jgi:superfamily II DNA or RNA helicase
LGKTIQAALIVAQMLRRCPDARVLVIAPASLVTQWCGELRERFDITACMADADSFARLRSDRRYLSNPWRSPGVWLASPDYLKQPHVIDGMPRLPFDLLVIDEAHIMAGNSQRHAAVDALARSARHVVMLTATPHDGDGTRFRRLASLGATGDATGSRSDTLTIFRRTRAAPARRLRTLDVDPGVRLSRVLAAIDSLGRARRFGAPADGLLLICTVFRKRALSSLAALAASLHRRLAVVNGAPVPPPEDAWTQPRLDFHDAGSSAPEDGDVMSADEWPAMRAVTGLPQARERAWLERLLSLTERTSSDATNGDPKLARLNALLRRSDEPVVVFTEYRDSLLAIADVLAGARQVAVLHGGLSGPEQRRALGAFLHGGADALLATDVASQGLNLQHRARWVVHFDLPWTPMRLEQRIGRVDRIGQTRTVHVTALGVRHSAQIALRQRLTTREEARDNVPLSTCTRWTRAADGLARLFARQRALAARWRGPAPMAVPRARVTASTLTRLGLEAQAGQHPVTIVELPLIAETGEVIERWFGWIAGAGPREFTGDPPPLLLRRARVLGARAARRLERLRAAQGTDARRTPSQPGLFEARDRTGYVSAESNDAASGAIVRIGEPRPLLILERR